MDTSTVFQLDGEVDGGHRLLRLPKMHLILASMAKIGIVLGQPSSTCPSSIRAVLERPLKDVNAAAMKRIQDNKDKAGRRGKTAGS